jgi:endoglucanase
LRPGFWFSKWLGSVSFTVSGAHGAVLRGRSAADAGYWNQRYQAVYELPFSAVRRPGWYRITVTAGGQSATSPPLTIGATGAQYGRLVSNAVRYFTSERDGSDVEPAVLRTCSGAPRSWP